MDHVNRQDHKLLERPDDVNNLHNWRSIRDSKQGDLADNQSNATASMMANLCTKETKNYPGSPVAMIMNKAKECKGHHHSDGFKMDSKKLKTAWDMSYQLSQLRWIEQLKRGMYNPQEWYFRALTAALNQPRADIMCMNKCICTDESQPEDLNYRMNDEVPLHKRPMDCWWEPVVHSAEDRKRHLHRESLDGEAGELLVPQYKYLWNKSEYSQVHEAMPCAKEHQQVKMANNQSRGHLLIWDTGSTCNVHIDAMRRKESKIRSCNETFTGFAKGVHTECKKKAAVEYNGMRIPTSYRVPGATSNLGAGWTSRKEGISTYISGGGDQSYIQLKNKK